MFVDGARYERVLPVRSSSSRIIVGNGKGGFSF